MRRVIDILVIVSVLTVAVVVVRQRQAEENSITTAADVQQSLARLYERTSYFGALDSAAQDTKTLWPVAVLPEWFGESLPTNALLPGVETHGKQRATQTPRPWLDIAPPGDHSPHPPDPVAVRPEQAQFWYNPNIGAFRARVAAHLGETNALSLYNQLNGVELEQLHRDTDPTRNPLAYQPGTTPSTTLASVDRSPTSRAQSSLFQSDSAPGSSSEPIYAELLSAPVEVPARPRGRTRLKNRTP